MSETIEELQKKNTFLEKSLSQLAKVSSVESQGSHISLCFIEVLNFS